MKDNLYPETYTDVLAVAKRSDMLTWIRGALDAGGTLHLTLDDYAADLRTVIEVRTASGKSGVVEIKSLTGYNKEKHSWTRYCAPAGSISLPNRRGEKQLRAWIRERAIAQKGYPNPEMFSIFRHARPGDFDEWK